MTAEIAILNRSAVALAADSATTVTYWESGERKTRFFKDANKIFHISERFPVGLMIYSNSELQGIPWEVIAKAYRDTQGTSPHSKLDEYVTDFFEFIKGNGHLFPAADQEQQLIASIVKTAGIITLRANPKPDDVAASGKSFKDLSLERFDQTTKLIESTPFIGGADATFVKTEVAKFKKACIKGTKGFSGIEADVDFKPIQGHITGDQVFELAALGTFKKVITPLQSTGLAFAGYGETEYFPGLRHYMCHGLLLGRLLCEEVDNGATVNLQNSSEIRPLASTDMINTFIRGASRSALREMDLILGASLNGLEDDLVKAGKLPKAGDIDVEKKTAESNFGDGLSKYLWETHTAPLRRVIGMLSIGDLAQLAETLVSIESLKERVTQNTEHVSGPVDVAVISKSDGFIWLKRKHYFDPKLNPRFFARKGLN